VGAAAFSHFASSGGLGLPWLVALLLAGLVTVPIGAFVAIPAIRLSGLFLALATFGFGILVERMGFSTALMFGGAGARHAPRPGSLFGLTLGSDTGFYYVCLAVALAACVALYAVNRSRLGRLLLAMADSPTALVTHGANVDVSRVLVFCISAALAGIAGALFASLSGSISGVGFGAFQSLTWLTVLAIAGSGEFSAAFIAAFVLAAVPSYANSKGYTDLQPVFFGVLAIGAALAQGGRFPLVAWFRRSQERNAQRADRSPVTARVAEAL
jgi:ABC-type branched-subunit amino acid transport system permease subunit